MKQKVGVRGIIFYMSMLVMQQQADREASLLGLGRGGNVQTGQVQL